MHIGSGWSITNMDLAEVARGRSAVPSAGGEERPCLATAHRTGATQESDRTYSSRVLGPVLCGQD
jgi:hypothetical protein